jgi:Protein of unknown function (DUF1071)
MSKSEKVNQNAAPEIGVGSVTGVISIEHILLKLNVNDHTEKKRDLTYLSWAWAWQEALKIDASATFAPKMYPSPSGAGLVPYIAINDTAMVEVEVTLGGRTRSCMLPVMDHRNQAISEPNAFQVNTAIMRCMTKCLALFGLGLYIYAGEDLPEDTEDAKPTTKEVTKPQEREPGDDTESESLHMFADAMIHHLDLQDTIEALKSYWKSNSAQLDKLKRELPSIYEKVLAAVKARQEFLKGQ